MTTEQRYRTPDGRLELIVERHGEDISVGFDGYPWHTHPEVLVGEYQLVGMSVEPEAAVEKFIADIRSNIATIIVYRKHGKIEDVSVSIGPPEEDEYLEPGEIKEIRYWSK